MTSNMINFINKLVNNNKQDLLTTWEVNQKNLKLKKYNEINN